MTHVQSGDEDPDPHQLAIVRPTPTTTSVTETDTPTLLPNYVSPENGDPLWTDPRQG